MEKQVTKKRLSSQRYKQDIKRKLLAKIADFDNNGFSRKGLLYKAMKSIESDLDSSSLEDNRAGRADLLKLLPYCIEREEKSFKGLNAINPGQGIYIQLNYLNGTGPNNPNLTQIPQDTQKTKEILVSNQSNQSIETQETNKIQESQE